jgi:uncharacterized protein (DUF2336 family)
MTASRLTDLIALAEEPSSAKRRELLRGLTDVFFSVPSANPTELALFDTVMGQLAGEMEDAVRAQLAGRMADSVSPPPQLMNRLAVDSSMTVAEPVLSRGVLSEATLMQIAASEGQERLRAISRREHVPQAVSHAIVQRSDDETLGVLLRNNGAEMSRATQESVIERAAANPALHEAVIDRHNLPVDLLNEMYFVVEARLRDRILARNVQLDPAELEAALEAGRKSVAARDGSLPADYAEAERYVRALVQRGGITPSILASMLRNRETTRFLVALAEMTDIDFHAARRILEARELDALAIVCKSAGFDRSLFMTFAVLMLDGERDAINAARGHGELYDQLSRDAAQRTIRFWRMRRRAGNVPAAA